jgi:hypothetical protein
VIGSARKSGWGDSMRARPVELDDDDAAVVDDDDDAQFAGDEYVEEEADVDVVDDARGDDNEMTQDETDAFVRMLKAEADAELAMEQAGVAATSLPESTVDDDESASSAPAVKPARRGRKRVVTESATIALTTTTKSRAPVDLPLDETRLTGASREALLDVSGRIVFARG